MTDYPRCPRLGDAQWCDLHNTPLPRHRRYCATALADRPTQAGKPMRRTTTWLIRVLP